MLSGRQEIDAQTDVIQSLQKNLANQENNKKKMLTKLNDQIKAMEYAFEALRHEKDELEAKGSQIEDRHRDEIARLMAESNDHVKKSEKEIENAETRHRDEVAQLEERLRNCDNELRNVQTMHFDEVEALQLEVGMHKRAKDDCNAALRNKSAEISCLQAANLDLQAKVGDENEKAEVVTELQSMLHAQAARMEELEAELGAKVDEVQTWRRRLEESEAAFADFRERTMVEINSKNTQHEKTWYELSALKDKMVADDKEMKVKMADLMSQLSDVELELVDQKVLMSAVEGRLDKVMAEKSELCRLLEASGATVDDLQTKLDLVRDEVAQLEEMVARYHVASQAVDELLLNLWVGADDELNRVLTTDELPEKVRILESLVKNGRRELEERLVLIQNELQVQIDELMKVNQNRVELVKANEAFAEAMRDVNRTLSQKTGTLETLSNEINVKNHGLQAMADEVDTLRRQLEDSGRTAESRLDDDQVAISRLRSELADSWQVVESLRKELSERQVSLENMEADVMKKVELITQLNNQIEGLMSKEAELVKAHRAQWEEGEEMKLRNGKLDEETKRLQASCVQLTEATNADKDRMDGVVANYGHCREQLNDVRQQLEASDWRRGQLEAEIGSMAADKDAIAGKVTELSTQVRASRFISTVFCHRLVILTSLAFSSVLGRDCNRILQG